MFYNCAKGEKVGSNRPKFQRSWVVTRCAQMTANHRIPFVLKSYTTPVWRPSLTKFSTAHTECRPLLLRAWYDVKCPAVYFPFTPDFGRLGIRGGRFGLDGGGIKPRQIFSLRG